MQTEFLILGAGVTGLSAAVALEDNAIVLEKEATPGGLVRSKCFHGSYWFDNVLHILHFKDKAIEDWIRLMPGNEVLQPCPPVAWIECAAGTALYPFQLNIGALDESARNQCIADYAKAYFCAGDQRKNDNYETFLQATFGDAMCQLFYFPYNQKLYKYPLNQITASDILWNIHQPSFDEILQGAFNPNQLRTTYNSNAYYPRPPKDAPVRGMEILSQSLAQKVHRLQLNTSVTHIDLPAKTVFAQHNGRTEKYRFTQKCLSTLPLPQLMRLCSNVPHSLQQRVNKLHYTRVLSVALCIKGKRPANPGHWRYYTAPEIPFTRLIFMTEFDPHNAPEDGWGLLAEITWNCAEPLPNEHALVQSVTGALQQLALLDEDSHIISTHVWTADPAYVVFTFETEQIIRDCFAFLDKWGIQSGGRYGSWEYSSMYQNIKAGFQWAQQATKTIPV